jgi:caffeoyl-CoA O-methyltransferase
MAPIPTDLTPELFEYVVAHSGRLDEVAEALIADTQALGGAAGLQISPDEGAFLTLLTKLLGVRDALEIGTFTGFSALCIARGLAPDGHLTCCDVSEEWTTIARKHWAAAGLSDRIELRLGPGVQTLRAMPAEQSYDLVFLDADKPGYPDYWEEIVPRVRPGGVILVDNVFYHGSAVDPSANDAGTLGIRALNERARTDERVEATMLTISDGLLLARKR